MNKRNIFALTGLVFILIAATATLHAKEIENKIEVRVLILPKFEVGEMSGDFPGEAQYYYENYLEGCETYEIGENKLYIKDGTAMYLLGMGKVSAAIGTMAVLSDPRFDFSDAYIISTGCAGSSAGNTVMGDVFIITTAVDYDLGHHVDSREMTADRKTTWFHDPDFDDIAVIRLNPDLMDKVYQMVKDVELESTEKTKRYMKAAFDGADWAIRDPMVQKGTTVTGDNYWKGQTGHENALLMTDTYECADPYVLTEMEDAAVGRAVKQMGLLDRFIIIRDSVNMDVYMLGATPESLWDQDSAQMDLASEDNIEAFDIFETAMKNNYAVGHVVIDAILNGVWE